MMKYNSSLIKLIMIAAALIVCALFLFSCGSEEKADETEPAFSVSTETESETEKSVTVTAEDITDGNGKVIGKRGVREDGSVEHEEYYDYAGRIKSYTTYTSDGKPSTVSQYVFMTPDSETPDYYSIERYKYSDGAITERTVERHSGEGFLLDSVYTYDGNDALKEARRYEYDDDGRITKETFVNSKNIISRISEYEYENDRILKEIYKSGSGQLMSYTEYTYSESGLVLKETNFDADGNITSYLNYVYGENDEFVETEEYMPDENGEFVLVP